MKGCLLFWLSLLPFVLSAQHHVRIRVEPQSKTVFNGENKPRIQAIVVADSAAQGELSFQVATDRGQQPVCQFIKPYALHGGDSVEIGFGFDVVPGFYHVNVLNQSEKAAEFNFGFEPERIASPCDAPADFEAFWNQARKELSQIAPHYRMHLDKKRSTDRRKVYLVEMQSLGNEKICGYYLEPTASGSYPAVIQYLGYNSDSWCPSADSSPDRIEFILSHRGQGLNKPTNKYGEWITNGIASAQTYYYRGAYMDAVRAVDFIASRAKVNRHEIFAGGGSQGGALALAATALDHRISAAFVSVPFMNDFPDYFQIVSWPAKPILAAADSLNLSRENLYHTLSYFDIKNLTPWITCPVLMGFGLQDDVCPPHTNFAGFNHLQGPKRWMVFPMRGHDVYNEPAWNPECEKFIQEQIRRIEQQGNNRLPE